MGKLAGGEREGEGGRKGERDLTRLHNMVTALRVINNFSFPSARIPDQVIFHATFPRGAMIKTS